MTFSLLKPEGRVHTTKDVLFDLHSQVSASLPILSPGKLDLTLMVTVLWLYMGQKKKGMMRERVTVNVENEANLDRSIYIPSVYPVDQVYLYEHAYILCM